MKTFKIEEDISILAREVVKDLKASPSMGLFKCIQCGMCVSLCPAAQHTDYNPRKMVKKVLDGEEEIINDDEIWNCFYCYACHSACPVNNSPCEVNQILRQMSLDKGPGIDYVAPFLTYGDSFRELGIGSIPSEFFDNLVNDFGEDWLNLKINLDQVRKELGLGEVVLPPDSINEVNKILKSTGFLQRLDKFRRFNEKNTR